MNVKSSMNSAKLKLPRRKFLRVAGGVSLGLPLLEAFQPRHASAQSNATPPFVLLVVHGNGVVQAGKAIDGSTDPERFWPTATGALSAAAMQADIATRATAELAAHATRLSMVRGVNHPFEATGCMHASGDAQLLTARKLVGSSNKVLALGESMDSLIARELNPAGREPLVLHAGKYSAGGTGFDIPGYVSYVGASQPRTYLDAPYRAYQRIIELTGPGGETTVGAGPSEAERVAALRSKSVNDLLRGQIQELLARTDLSQSDRQRLDQHFTAIRDIELRMSEAGTGFAAIPAESLQAMQAIDPKRYDMASHEKLIALHMQLLVFAIASGYTRVAVLRVGDRQDDHEFTFDGTTFIYHTASHRAVVDGAALCSKVDFVHMRYFKGLLDQLAATQTPTGDLLDAGVTVWTNQVATGNHSFVNVPWLLAGSAGGFLKTGQFVDVAARGYKTNRMLNTLINAAGVRKPDTATFDDFGDSSLSRGLVDEVVNVV
jgi:hypothetical protein